MFIQILNVVVLEGLLPKVSATHWNILLYVSGTEVCYVHYTKNPQFDTVGHPVCNYQHHKHHQQRISAIYIAEMLVHIMYY